jgi:cysteine protease ATG4
VGELLIAEDAVTSGSVYDCYVLGLFYDSVSFPVRRRHEFSLYWFSYRSLFPPLPPYPITTDAGWGCMLRASQMLLAEGIRRHARGRLWQPSTAARDDKFDESILTAFADQPSKTCPFSIHALCRAGLGHDKYPGEWVGPQAACHVLRDAIDVADDSSALWGDKRIKVFVAEGSCLYVDEVENYMTPPAAAAVAVAAASRGGSNTAATTTAATRDLTDSDPFDPLFHPPPVPDAPPVVWTKALIVLVPLCFGNFRTMKQASREKRGKIKDFFAMEQCLGALGGTPRHAIWFYGCSSNDGAETALYGLDPHTVQFGPGMNRNGTVALSKDYRKSVHTNGCSTQMNDIDPTLALGFYVQDRAAFLDLVVALKGGICRKGARGMLFGVEDYKPDYESNVGVMDDLMGGGASGDESGGDLSDEDDFVII